MPNYAPTQNPGDTRTRCRYLGIWNPLNAAPHIDVLEQEVVRLADGEVVLKDANGFSAGLDGDAFPLLDPRTDEPLGGEATAEQVMMMVYSWTRYQQHKRDERETAKTQEPQA